MSWSPTAPILWLLVLIYFLYRIIPRYLNWCALRAIPGPDCGFWVGKFWAIYTEPFMDPHQRWWKETGYDKPLMRYSKLVGDHMIVVLDPDIAKDILMANCSKDDARFYRPSFFFLPEIIGKGLLTLEGTEWMQHRRLTQPAFSLSSLKESLEMCVPDKVVAFVQHWINAGEGHEIDVSTHLAALTLDVMGDAGFSYDCKGLSDIERWAENAKHSPEETPPLKLTDPLIASITALMKPDLSRVFLYLLGFGKVGDMVNKTVTRVRAALNNTVDEIIANAKREEQTTCPSTNPRKNSLLHILLDDTKDPDIKDPKKSALTDLELRDEMKAFLLAGHETTSAWCYWAMFALSKFPDAQEKLYQDVIKHAPKDTTTHISLEQVESMEYLAAFLQEVLRLYSPVGFILRLNRYEEKFAGYAIPKYTSLLIPSLLMHRHPQHWKDPKTFSPERWLNSPLNGMDNRGFTFLPFGAGGHGCVGYRFAIYEAKFIMAHMVRALHIDFAPSQRDVEHILAQSIITKAKPGLKIVVKPRKLP